MHFCPHSDCDYRGWLGLGNLRANGHPNGGPWRQFQCTACEGYFPEHHGTIFHGKQAAVELIVRVLAYLAEGLGIRATARVFEVDPNTVLHWLVEAAEHLRAFSASFLCDLHVEQLQLDELYAVLRGLKAGEISDAEAIKRLERSPDWVWTAMDPTSKLLVVVDVGSRTLAMAQRGPCTPNLRIIPIAQKPDKMVSFPDHVRRLCHDTTPLLLSTGGPGPGVVVCHAAPPLADPIQWAAQEAS
jgi:transposase-like protein